MDSKPSEHDTGDPPQWALFLIPRLHSTPSQTTATCAWRGEPMSGSSTEGLGSGGGKRVRCIRQSHGCMLRLSSADGGWHWVFIERLFLEAAAMGAGYGICEPSARRGIAGGVDGVFGLQVSGSSVSEAFLGQCRTRSLVGFARPNDRHGAPLPDCVAPTSACPLSGPPK